jgi:cytochrome d ubiquinol oxidase subunit I
VEFDPTFLSRLQFAFVVSFHILFPAFTIGLASYIVVLEALWYWTGRRVYFVLSEFWIRLFAVSFGMGVVSGIVMSYQFGTNWGRFSDATGNVLGPLLSYEVIMAFFLEAGFLGILLFGRSRVPKGLHFVAALAVGAGTLFSAFWILSANSWMHTPAGYEVRDGIFYVTDWWEVVFNPSFPYRLAHMVTAAYLTTAFTVVGVSAWYLLRRSFEEPARVAFSMGLGLITLLAPLQIVIGDMHGLNTLEHQPAKIAAIEGHWEPERGAPAILFAIPDVEAETNHYQIGIPKLGSLVLTHSLDGAVPGLKEWAPEDRPYMPIPFFAFRIMVAIGFLMLAVGLFSLYLRVRERLYDVRWFQWLCFWCMPIGYIAILAGWFTTETGRQPWVVYGHMRTVEAGSPSLTTTDVAISLATFIVVYAIIFGAGIYYMTRLVRAGPPSVEEPPPAGTPMRPLSRPAQSFEPGD